MRKFACKILDLILWMCTLKGKFLSGNRNEEIPYEKVSFTSRSSKHVLSGWFCEHPKNERSERSIIFVHGGMSNGTDPSIGILKLAEEMYLKGFNVLIFDLRGHGKSEGKFDFQSLSNLHEDVLGAVYFVKRKGFMLERTGIVSFSLGAAASLSAVVREERIKWLVLDSIFPDWNTVLKKTKGSPGNWIKTMGKTMSWFINKTKIMMRDPSDVFLEIKDGRIYTEILLIHGEKDEVTPCAEAERFYRDLRERIGPNVNFKVVLGASHCQNYNKNKEDYVSTLSQMDERLICDGEQMFKEAISQK